MAQFEPAYELERKHEGYYVNNPLDKGGETYAGIARKIHPSNSIWQVIDLYKEQIKRPLKWNEKVPNTEPYVKAFYRALWDKNNFGLINSQTTANILYDWFINSGYLAFKTTDPETFGVDEILNRDFKKSVPIDGRLDPDTLQAINSVDNVRLYNTIKNERKKFYYRIVEKNPSQKPFLSGWISRINSFSDLSPVIKGGAAIVVVLILFIIFSTK